MWAGEADPCAGRAEIEADDSEFALQAEVLDAWYRCFHNERRTLKDVMQTIDDMRHQSPSGFEDLYQALKAFDTSDNSRLNTRVLGKALQKIRGRIIGGKRLVRAGHDRKRTGLWYVEEV